MLPFIDSKSDTKYPQAPHWDPWGTVILEVKSVPLTIPGIIFDTTLQRTCRLLSTLPLSATVA